MRAEMEAAGIQELIDDIQFQLDQRLAKQAAQAERDEKQKPHLSGLEQGEAP